MTVSSRTRFAAESSRIQRETKFQRRLLIACDGRTENKDVTRENVEICQESQGTHEPQQEDQLYFVLLTQHCGEDGEIIPALSASVTHNSTITNGSSYDAGTLWHTLQLRGLQGKESTLHLTRTDASGTHFIAADRLQVKELLQRQYDCLSAISNVADRIPVCLSAGWLDEADRIEMNNRVSVQLPHSQVMTGRVQYIGHLVGRNGYWFGVSLDAAYRGLGSTEGIWRKKMYFHCDENSGVFVNLLRIRLLKEDAISTHSYPDVRPKTFPNQRCVSEGDRVIYFTDEGIPEYATAKYIGSLPDKNGELYVGVEFDNLIGKGNGKYKGLQLFEAKRGHASLIPMIGLVKDESCQSGTTASIQQHHINPVCIPKKDIVNSARHLTDKPSPASDHPVVHEFSVGTKVECLQPVRYGTIRWLEKIPEVSQQRRLLAGIELEEADTSLCTDGVFEGQRKFHCAPGHALFLHINKLRPDRRQDLVDHHSDVLES